MRSYNLPLAAVALAGILAGCAGQQAARPEQTHKPRPVTALQPSSQCSLDTDPVGALTGPLLTATPCLEELGAMRDKLVQKEQAARAKAEAKAQAEAEARAQAEAEAAEEQEEQQSTPTYEECAQMAQEASDGIPPQICLDTYGDEGASVDAPSGQPDEGTAEEPVEAPDDAIQRTFDDPDDASQFLAEHPGAACDMLPDGRAYCEYFPQ